MGSLLGLASLSAGATSCDRGSIAVPPWPHIRAGSQAAIGTLSTDALFQAVRAPDRDWRQSISISIRDEASGIGFEGRGVVAVRPEQALRMILIGPGGGTAMDLWIGGDRFRAEIPAVGRIVRGDRRTPAASLRGMPVGLLDDWLVDPIGHHVTRALAAKVDPNGELVADRDAFVAWLARDDGADNLVEVRARWPEGDAFAARAWWFRHGQPSAFLEGVERPIGAGGSAVAIVSLHYRSIDPPMSVSVDAEDTVLIDPSTPLPPQTFADPDGAR